MKKRELKRFKKFLKKTSLPQIYLNELEMLEDFAEYKRNRRRYKLCLGLATGMITLAIAAAANLGIYVYKSFDFNEPNYASAYAEPGFYNKNPIKFTINLDDFSPREINLIFRAVKELDDDALGIKFVYSPEGANFGFFKSQTTFIDGNFITAACASLGDLEHGVILVGKNYAANADETKFVAILKHEILHILGLFHSHNPESILFPYTMVPNLSEEDKANLNFLYPEK